MRRRHFSYLAIALLTLGFAACSVDATGPELQQPEFSADSSGCKQVSGGWTKC